MPILATAPITMSVWITTKNFPHYSCSICICDNLWDHLTTQTRMFNCPTRATFLQWNLTDNLSDRSLGCLWCCPGCFCSGLIGWHQFQHYSTEYIPLPPHTLILDSLARHSYLRHHNLRSQFTNHLQSYVSRWNFNTGIQGHRYEWKHWSRVTPSSRPPFFVWKCTHYIDTPKIFLH